MFCDAVEGEKNIAVHTQATDISIRMRWVMPEETNDEDDLHPQIDTVRRRASV